MSWSHGAASSDGLTTSGWFEHYSMNDAAHAITCDDRELNDALEAWWNALELPGSPMIFAEIRVKAAMES